MLSFVQNFFAQKANPIGVDFGSDSLRLAQVQYADKEFRLIAAASADVPSHIRHDPAARLNFFVETTRDLLAQGKFRGREAVLSLPASVMFIQHLRLPRMDDEALKKALPWEARGKLPIDPSHALIRHLVAGEIYQDQEPKSEVIVMAAAREWVNQYLALAAKARLDVVGMNVEPRVLVDCFTHIYRRKSDGEVTNCFVDIGCSASRAVISRGQQILFARSIPVGGDHFNRAVSQAMKSSFEDAKMLRIKLCHANPSLDEHRERQTMQPPPAPAQPAAPSEENSFALLSAGIGASERRQGGSALAGARVPSAKADPTVAAVACAIAEAPLLEDAPIQNETREAAAKVEQACAEPLNKLISELDLCRRYYEATFPNKPVERLIFVGGEARQRGLCQQIARQMSLAAQVGDPLVRMGRISEVGIESGIDRRQPQPGWAVAIGLSLGPAGPQENRQ
ncbi:MAG TPA: pilus assembly protein PilM [Tepidisphaeraceae bacterium]|jgi:type IV pilus assembly protein PilM